MPMYAAVFRFVCGVPVGIDGRTRTCGDSVGPSEGGGRSHAKLCDAAGTPRDVVRPEPAATTLS